MKDLLNENIDNNNNNNQCSVTDRKESLFSATARKTLSNASGKLFHGKGATIEKQHLCTSIPTHIPTSHGRGVLPASKLESQFWLKKSVLSAKLHRAL